MNLLIETNFLLELALGQEQANACEKLLIAAERAQITLHIPAFCLMEAVHKLGGLRQSGAELEDRMTKHLREVQREAPDGHEMQQLKRSLNTVFELRTIRQQEQFMENTRRLLVVAHQIALTENVWLQLPDLQNLLTLPDAIVAASVLLRAEELKTAGEAMLFVSRDQKAFRQEEMRQLFSRQGCEVLLRFDHVCRRLRLL